MADQSGTLATMAGLLVASAFFSGSETALFSLRADDLRDMAARRPRLSRLVRSLLKRADRLLVSILVGNLALNVLFFSGGTQLAMRAHERFGAAGSLATSAATLLALVLFGEITPKALAAAAPVSITAATAWPLWLFSALVGRPASALAAPVTLVVRSLARRNGHGPIEPEELKMLVEMAQHSGAVSGAEAEMLEAVVELAEIRVRDIMVHRVDVLFASASDSPEQVLRAMQSRTVSAAPVYDGRRDNVIGLVYARDLIAQARPERARPKGIRDLVKPIRFVPESARLTGLLEDLQKAGMDMAVAVDEYGGTAGLISIQDVAETVVGDIPDEFTPREDPEVVQLGPGAYLADADLSIREWAELLQLEPQPAHYGTLGGFVTYLLGRIPREGDIARWGGMRFVVRRMRKRRVVRVEISIEAPQ